MSKVDLSLLDDAFTTASTSLPDGPYLVEVETVELTHTRNSHRPMLCWTLRVVRPPAFAGRHLWRRQVLGPSTLGWLKKDLALCGLDLARLSELPDHLPALQGLIFEVLKRTRDDFESIFLRRRLHAAE